MDNQSNDKDAAFKGFLIVSSIFIFIYYIALLICFACNMKYVWIFMSGLTIGIAVAMALAGIIYGCRVNDPDNKLTFQKAVEKTILCGIYFGFTCSLLYILSKNYKYNLELLIMSTILLAGILASIGTSIPWQSLIGIGIVGIYVVGRYTYLKIKEYYRRKAEAQKAHNASGNMELQEM